MHYTLYQTNYLKPFKKIFVHSSFIGEESVAAGAGSILTDNPTWIIDPIDGTTNFVHRYVSASPSTCPGETIFLYLILLNQNKRAVLWNDRGGGLFLVILSKLQISIIDTPDNTCTIFSYKFKDIILILSVMYLSLFFVFQVSLCSSFHWLCSK